VSGTSIRRLIDEGEALQGCDDADRQRGADLPTQQRDCEAEKLAREPGAVDPRRVVEIGRNALDSGQEQDEAEAEVEPDRNQSDRDERSVEVPEPRSADLRSEADGVQ